MTLLTTQTHHDQKPKSEPFYPMTGNPEAHDYLDFYKHLEEQGLLEKKQDA